MVMGHSSSPGPQSTQRKSSHMACYCHGLPIWHFLSSDHCSVPMFLMHWALVFSRTVMACVWMAPWGFSLHWPLLNAHIFFSENYCCCLFFLCVVHPNVLNCLRNVCTVELHSRREKLASVWFIYYQRHWGLEGYFHTELFQWNDTADIFRLL